MHLQRAISRIHKGKRQSPTLKWTKDLSRYIAPEIHKQPVAYLFSQHRMQIKTPQCHFTATWTARVKMTDSTCCWQGQGAFDSPTLVEMRFPTGSTLWTHSIFIQRFVAALPIIVPKWKQVRCVPAAVEYLNLKDKNTGKPITEDHIHFDSTMWSFQNRQIERNKGD